MLRDLMFVSIIDVFINLLSTGLLWYENFVWSVIAFRICWSI